jgi:NAD(P)H-hydrate repair Nnr-like enzyme with NAD(P)H-hydrate dehydratase domain
LGDVPAGIIGGLLARAAASSLAAAWRVWLHGESGRRCAKKQGRIGLPARDSLPWISVLMDPRATIGPLIHRGTLADQSD